MIQNFIVFLLVCLSTSYMKVEAQHLDIQKSSTGIAGSSYFLKSENLIISHTVGQPSTTDLLSGGSIQLLQGFEYLLNSRIWPDPSVKHTLTLSPNPTDGMITMEWSESIIDETINLTVFDLNGRRIATRKTIRSGLVAKLNLDLPNGIYLVETSGALSGHSSNLIIIYQ